LVDEPEQPISREEFLRELRKQGVKPTGEEIAEADIRAAWEATANLKVRVLPLRPKADGEGGARTIPWYEGSRGARRTVRPLRRRLKL